MFLPITILYSHPHPHHFPPPIINRASTPLSSSTLHHPPTHPHAIILSGLLINSDLTLPPFIYFSSSNHFWLNSSVICSCYLYSWAQQVHSLCNITLWLRDNFINNNLICVCDVMCFLIEEEHLTFHHCPSSLYYACINIGCCLT